MENNSSRTKIELDERAEIDPVESAAATIIQRRFSIMRHELLAQLRHVVTAEEVRALVGVVATELDVSKAIFTTTSTFAPKLREDRLQKPLLPTRLELVDKTSLISRLSWRN